MDPMFVKKDWGWELWFANVKDGPDYCGKILYVENGKWSSKGRYHYHKVKDETFMVIEGLLQLDIVDNDNRSETITLSPNHTYRVKPGVKHRFTSVSKTGCKFIEVSTFHSDSDSYRCTYDIESGNWLEWPPSV